MANTTSRYSLNKNKYLLEPEAEKLEEILEKFFDTNERDTLILNLALKTGARAQEVLNLKKSDLNPYDKTVFINGIKGSNDREIPLPPRLFDRLHRWSSRQPGDRVFEIS
ncbi:MAG: tyrosine-type recombinase/integrase, partial [Bdellovibrionales bacterium]|nr:tyrosine-type recombinase/integrase [Bdellovibrionales bacterium]